jgi:hypothetical protein
MLSALIVLSIANVAIHIYRVFRRPAGGAAIDLPMTRP